MIWSAITFMLPRRSIIAKEQLEIQELRNGKGAWRPHANKSLSGRSIDVKRQNSSSFIASLFCDTTKEIAHIFTLFSLSLCYGSPVVQGTLLKLATGLTFETASFL